MSKVSELLKWLQTLDPEEAVEIWGNIDDDGQGNISVGLEAFYNVKNTLTNKQ